MATRNYQSIGEVLVSVKTEFPDITISKIRFLESQGLIDPERTGSGYRKFYNADIERLRFILREQRENFLPLKVIKDRLDEALVPASGTPPAERLPVWMQDRVGGSDGRGVSPTGLSLTLEELSTASGLDRGALGELEQFGLIEGRHVGPAIYYDESALIAAKLAAGFRRHGVEPRHLRMYRNTADREAALFEQIVLPLLKQRNPQARVQALEALGDLARLGEELRAEMLKRALRSYTEAP